MTRYQRVTLARQAGTVLVISLVILLAMTIIGLTAMQTTVLEERMAGNIKDHNTAFQATAAGLRESLDWVELKLKSAVGLPLANSSGSNKIWEECAFNKQGTLCNDGTTAQAASALGASGVAFGSYTGMTPAELLPLKSTLCKSNPSTCTRLPRTVVEERYAPPPEYEQAINRKGIVNYTVTGAGSGGTANAQSVDQTTVAVPRL